MENLSNNQQLLKSVISQAGFNYFFVYQIYVEVFMSHFCWLFVLWQNHLGDLCTAIRKRDVELARRWSKSKQWRTVIQLMQAAKGKMVPTISFFYNFLSLSFFFLSFFFKFCLLNLLNLKREGPYAGIDWLSFFY